MSKNFADLESDGSSEWTGILHRPDGTIEGVTNGERYLLRVDVERLYLDPEVEFSDYPMRPRGVTISAAFTPAKMGFHRGSILMREGVASTDLHALITDARATGRREYLLSEFPVVGVAP